MRTFKVWPVTAALLAAYAIQLPASAQQADVPPPPTLENLEEGEPPAVTIRKPGEEKQITEKRAPGGRVTEVKVSTGGSTYYLRPQDPPGSALPGDTQASPFRPAQWEVLEFDVIRSKEAQEAEAAQAATVPAPPAPAEPAKK